MSEMKLIETPVLPTVKSGTHDFTTVFQAVGNELNRQYWENRELYLTRVVDPLSKVETNDYTKDLVNDIRNEVTETFNDVDKKDNWHQAGNAIYEATQTILTSQPLKDAIQNNEEYKAFIKTLSESDWDTESKEGFMALASHQSSKLVKSKDGKTTSGGFKPVQIGTPFDVTKYINDVSNIISKMKADGVTYDTLETNPDRLSAYGIDTITGLDNKDVASHLLKITTENEGIDASKINSVVISMLQNNPEYLNHLGTLYDLNYARNYLKPNGEKIKLTVNDIVSTLDPVTAAINHTLYETPYGIDDLVKTDSNGKYIIKNDLDSTAKQTFEDINNSLGVNILDVLNGKKQINSLTLDTFARGYVEDCFDTYKETNPNSTMDYWGHAIMKQNFINDSINDVAQSLADLHSYHKTKQNLTLINNPAYKEVIKARYRAQEKSSGIDIPSTSITPWESVSLAEGNHYSRIQDYNTVNENKIKLVNDNKNLRTQLEKNKAFIGVDTINDENIRNIDLDILKNNLQNKVNNKELTESDAETIFENITELKTNLSYIDHYNTNIKNATMDYNRLKSDYDSNRSNYVAKLFGGFGNKIFQQEAVDIMDHGLFSYDDYYNYRMYNPIIYQSSYNPHGEPLKKDPMSKEEYESYLSDVITQIQNQYENIHDEKFEYTTSNFIVNRGHPKNEAWLQNMIDSKLSQAVIVESPTGKHEDITGVGITQLIQLDRFKQNVKVNDKGETITTYNEFVKGFDGINGESYGIDGKIYATDTRYCYDPSAISRGVMVFAITCYDKNNSPIGIIKAEQKIDPSSIHKLLLNDYMQTEHAYYSGTVGANEHRKNLIDSATNSIYKFYNISGTDLGNIGSLQSQVDKAGSDGLSVIVEIPNMINSGASNILKAFHLTKGIKGYTIRDITNSSTSGYFDWGGEYGKLINEYSNNAQYKEYSDLTNAFFSLTDWNLDANVKASKQGNYMY